MSFIMCAIQGKCLIVKVSKVVFTPLALSPNFLLDEISSYAVVPWEAVFLTTSLYGSKLKWPKF